MSFYFCSSDFCLSAHRLMYLRSSPIIIFFFFSSFVFFFPHVLLPLILSSGWGRLRVEFRARALWPRAARAAAGPEHRPAEARR